MRIMSVLSEKLKYYIDRKGQNIAGLAKKSKIERSTLYQYIKGKRPLQNRVQLEAIMSELHLTPDERAEMLDAYEISRIGEINYNRRRKVRKIIESLLTVEEVRHVFPTEEYKMDRKDLGENMIIQGELEVNRAVGRIIHDAMAKGGNLNLLIQPDYDFLMELIMAINDEYPDTKVKHIICLEADSGQDGCSNLENFQKIMRYGIGISKYEPRYYYGRAREHYGVMTVLPYLIVTDRYAVLISSDRKAAVLQSNEDIIRYLKELFDRMSQDSFSFMTTIDGIRKNQAAWGLEYIEMTDFSNVLEMCSGLCSIQFWDERLINKYINRNIPGYEKLAKDYTTYAKLLYNVKKQGKITVLMNAASVEEFIRSGVFREYPEIFFSKPLSPADRRVLIERILTAVEEGWYHIRIIPNEEFLLGDRWEILIQEDTHLLLQYSFKDQFKVFIFDEADILEAMYDFLKSLADGENALDDLYSMALLKKWVQEYLL